MAYQNPGYLLLHAGALAGEAALSTQNATEAGQGVARLIDRRSSGVLKFSASAADHHIQIDRGAGTLEDIDYLVIPSGHNLAGASIRVRQATDAAITTSVDTLLAATPVAAGLFATALSAFTAKRYVRLDWPSDTGQWELPELWFSRLRQTTTGIVPGWSAPPVVPVIVQEFPNRESAFTLGPQRRRFDLEHQRLSGTDLAVYDDLGALGRATSFYFQAPDDAEPWRVMRLLGDLDREQDHPNPQGSVTYTVAFEAIEQVA